MTLLARGLAGRTPFAPAPACSPWMAPCEGQPWPPLSGFSCGCWWCSRRLRLPCILLEALSLWRLCAALWSVCCPPISIRNASGAFIFSVILIQIASRWFWIQEGSSTLRGKTLWSTVVFIYFLMIKGGFLSILNPFSVIVTVLWEHRREREKSLRRPLVRMQNPPNCSWWVAGLPRSSPAPILGGRAGAQQDGPGAPQGLQPKGNWPAGGSGGSPSWCSHLS